MEMTSGQRLGVYRVIRLLGKGGMGAVYEVEHAQGVVHRDIKLGNVLLSTGKHVVLSDFGV